MSPTRCLFALLGLLLGLTPQAHAVFGGTDPTLSNSVRSTVLIRRKIDDQSKGCSGVLITKNLVLTAAHCLLDPFEAPKLVVIKDLSVEFGVDCRFTPKSNIRKVVAVSIPTATTGKHFFDGLPPPKNIADIALAQIEGVAPAGYGPAQITDLPIEKGDSLLFAGYGLSSITDEVGEVLWDTDITVLDPNWSDTEFEVTAHQQAICPGDSGGACPALS